MGKYSIIGAGISGCTVALELAGQGHEVTLLEAKSVIGGAVLDYACKATDECSRCGVCVAVTQISQAIQHQRITTIVAASLQAVNPHNTHLDFRLTRKNPAIDYHICTFCDLCISACPEGCITKIQRGELIQYAFEYERCRLHQGNACGLCAEQCPQQAISAQSLFTEMQFSSDAVLIATGHAPYNAAQHVRFGYGRLANVMTGLEAEQILSRQSSLGDPAEDVAFIQCVGSRDPRIGRNYCSSVCCAYALRLAHIIKYRHPETPVTIYYIDIQHFDKTFSLFRKSVEASGVRFVRGIPFLIDRSSSGKLKLHIENMDGEETIVEHDRVVLSVGMGPADDASQCASFFGLERDQFGFFTSSTLPNVFVSGTCQEPQSISESMTAARAIALGMLACSGSVNNEQRTAQRPGNALADRSFERKKIPLQQQVLVLGDGIAAKTVVQELQGLHYPVACVESENLLEFDGNIGNFTAKIRTSGNVKSQSFGAVVLAPQESIAKNFDLGPHIASFAEIDQLLDELATRRGPISIGLVLDLERDESKASTETAFQIAKHIQMQPRYQAFLFCRDVRVAAKDLEMRYDEVRQAGVNIIKYEGQLTFVPAENGVTISCCDHILHQTISVYCDRVAVSPWELAAPEKNPLAAFTGVSTDTYHQMQDNNIHLFPIDTNRPGIFVVGACHGQHYLPQIMQEAKAAALEVHALLSQKELEVELSNAVIDPDKCILCLTCLRSCPHKAIWINHEKGAAESLPQVCKKCGICAGECPAKAIELPLYPDRVIEWHKCDE
ncbi:4Fe-4S ferredoxin, iron-sulfur binding [Candidatus Vecturithrix granuli]|uniref:4Fe-4S ferredoxin, iron-sulfur binding n=1 Tax=Vecturithrix granuli TaxID=1499967 RepID=A0A081C8G0_VECG1|nr:4Fe-4S ferredoxin, iron-sulfur binding [Candidatus Vecturithrix granuli]